MRIFVLIPILFFALCTASHAQNFSVNLSPKHLKKLETYQSGHQKLKHYYKFYKKDSTLSRKKLDKKYKRVLDSAYKADRKEQRLQRKMNRQGIPYVKKADSLQLEMKRYASILKDSTSSDSAKVVAKQKLKTLALIQAQRYPGFESAMNEYHRNGDSLQWSDLARQVPGLDTLSGVFDSSPDEFFQMTETQAEKILTENGALGSQFAQANELKSLPDTYMKQYASYSDPEAMQKEARTKAVEEAIDYFADHASELKTAQEKLSKLMSKYSAIPNSEDLSTATKRTSMEGKSFFEHLVIGGNFNIVSTQPVALDLSPQLGYKFTTRFFIGLGMNYRCTFGDSIRHSWYVSPNHLSFKAFANYDVYKSFFAVAEWEKASVSIKVNDRSQRVWKDNYMIGIGKRFLIHPKLYFTMTALYNLNSEAENPIEPRRFKIRLGFQLSELATRQKKPTYDPNR